MIGIGRPTAARLANQEQDLIDRIDERMNRLREHRARSGEREGDQLGDGDGDIAGKRGIYHMPRTALDWLNAGGGRWGHWRTVRAMFNWFRARHSHGHLTAPVMAARRIPVRSASVRWTRGPLSASSTTGAKARSGQIGA